MKKIYPNDYSTIMRVRYHGLEQMRKSKPQSVESELSRIEKLLESIAHLKSPQKEDMFVTGLLSIHSSSRLAA